MYMECHAQILHIHVYCRSFLSTLYPSILVGNSELSCSLSSFVSVTIMTFGFRLYIMASISVCFLLYCLFVSLLFSNSGSCLEFQLSWCAWFKFLFVPVTKCVLVLYYSRFVTDNMNYSSG